MKTILDVPFEEKDLAKQRGAKWDVEKKVWYVENVQNMRLFLQWIPERYKQPTKHNRPVVPQFKVVQPRTPRKKNNR